MAFEMVFNELSLYIAEDKYIAQRWMETFVKTIIKASQKGISRAIRTKSNFSDTLLAVNYPLRLWLNDSEVDRELRRRLRSIATRAPFWDGLPELYDRILLNEFKYGCKIAEGLGVAYLLNFLAISLLSDECWNHTSLQIKSSYLTEIDDIEEEIIQVKHASQPSHIEDHSEWIVKRLQQDIKDGFELWDRRNELFPSLIFCESVAEQLQKLDSVMLHSVTKKLFDFETYCANWASGDFDETQLPMKIKSESKATLNKYGHQRTFLCPNNESRIFSKHTNLTPREWRIHFISSPETRKIIIGYIGPHLDTVKYN